MRLPSLRRPSPSMAVSIMALVVASTGTSYAAGLIGSDDVRNNSLTTMDIKDKYAQGPRHQGRRPRVQQDPQRLAEVQGLQGRPAPRPVAIGPAGPAGVGRWALVDATGAIIAQSGGFTVTAGYPASARPRPTATSTSTPARTSPTTACSPRSRCRTPTDLNADGILNGRQAGSDSNPEFSGEIAVAMCQPGVVNCAPAGTGNTNHLVVSPRNSDGSFTTDGARKRFYVVVTGDSSDRG